MKAIMCHADTNPETLHWVDENQFPLGNRDSPHECVNWDLLMDGMKQSRVDPFKPGVLVHPKYGKNHYPWMQSFSDSDHGRTGRTQWKEHHYCGEREAQVHHQ